MAHQKYERVEGWDKMDLKSLDGLIQTKFQEMTKMDEGEALKSASNDVLTDFQTRNAELTDMRERRGMLSTAAEAYQKSQSEHKALYGTVNRNVPFAGGDGDAAKSLDQPYKSLGELYTEGPEYKALQGQGRVMSGQMIGADIGGCSIKSLDVGALKTTMTTAAGYAPYPTQFVRPPVMTPQIEPVVADLIPQSDTDQQVVMYYEETTYTNNADFVAEGGTKPDAALGLTRRDQSMCKEAVMLPVTEEQLLYVPTVREYIDGRLTLMIKQQEQVGLLRGNGVSPQLQGFHTKPGISSLARGAAEDNADVFLRAITQVNAVTGLANVSGIVMNPLQWLAIRMVRTTTGDYIWGHPSMVGPQTLWGYPVVQTNAETAGLGLVGDFLRYSHISRKMGLRIDVGYINDDFAKNIQRIRLEQFLTLEIYRALAFCEVTNLNAVV